MIYRVSLNGKVYEVEVEKGEAVIKAEFDAALPSAAPAPVVASATPAPAATPSAAPASGAATAAAILAPMPGNINAVKVSEGQSVAKGTVLVVLEAMKMENEIVAVKDGKVGRIYVQKGMTVETGAPLVEVL